MNLQTNRPLALLVLITTITFSGCASYKEKGMFRENQGIFTMVEPIDMALYRKLLPKEFSMPDHPTVALYAIDITQVVPWPMTPYKETAILLKSKYHDEEGWYVTNMAVTKWVPMKAGRYLGFPKYVADEITLQEQPNGWRGQTNHEGKNMMALSLDYGGAQNISEHQRESLLATLSSIGVTRPIQLLVPPGEGPTVQKVTTDNVVPPQWTAPRIGMVTITINSDDPVAGLFPAHTVAPGFFSHFVGGMNMEAQKLN